MVPFDPAPAMGDLAREGPSLWERVGSYDICKLLGRGGMASVYQGRHVRDGSSVAIKVLHPHLTRDEGSSARFLREARALSRIAHPNVVRVHEVGERDGIPYLVMSLVEGDDLSDHIRQLHPMPIPHIARCILPVIDAVATAHDAGVVHRDLKPSNIRLARGDRGGLTPTVLDFGISKLIKDDAITDLTETGESLGTVSYMAPEQLRSAKHVDVRSDIYALGVILFECATGRRPFRGQSAYDLMHTILTADVPPPSFYRPDIPPAFDAIVLRAMQRNPLKRFASARELLDALGHVASSQPERRTSTRLPVEIEAASRPTRTMACQILRTGDLVVALWLCTAADPAPDEWIQGCNTVADLVRSKNEDLQAYRGFVVTDGGAPSTIQRKQLYTEVYRGHRHKHAVVTTILRTSVVKRGIATAIQWLNPETRFFEPHEISRALTHLDIPHEQFSPVWTALASMQRSLPPNKALRLLGDELGFSASSPRV